MVVVVDVSVDGQCAMMLVEMPTFFLTWRENVREKKGLSAFTRMLAAANRVWAQRSLRVILSPLTLQKNLTANQPASILKTQSMIQPQPDDPISWPATRQIRSNEFASWHSIEVSASICFDERKLRMALDDQTSGQESVTVLTTAETRKGNVSVLL